jgi:hypothetical protein
MPVGPKDEAFACPSQLRKLHRFGYVIDVQTVSIEEHGSEKRVLPFVGNDLRLVRAAKPIEKAGERFKCDSTGRPPKWPPRKTPSLIPTEQCACAV